MDDGQSEGVAARMPSLPARQPLPVSTHKVIIVGEALWLIALALTLLVPSLHAGERRWWPWACVAGFVLGLLGLAYVRRGRGNAADVQH